MQPGTRPPTPEEFQAVRERIIHAYAPEIVRCTIPFYGWMNEEPVQNGTGILFRLGNVHFVIAAAHVLDYPSIHGIPYLTGGEGGRAVPLTIKKVVTSPIPAGYRREESDMRDHDPWDIGIAELDDETVIALKSFWRFAQLRELEPSPEAPQAIYYVAGYPFQLTVHNIDSRTTETSLLSYVTAISEEPNTPETRIGELRLEYPLENMDMNGNIVKLPHPKGMSGCGIWRLNDPSKPLNHWQPADVRLVGIEHRWSKPNRYLTGTSIRYAMQLILKHYPELQVLTTLVYPS